MKTKELIEELQKYDPSGELEVVAGGVPIYFIQREPAYYDGPLHMLVQDKNCDFYNIVGYKITTIGEKIKLHLMDWDDVIENENNMRETKFDLSDLNDHRRKEWEKLIKDKRNELIVEEIIR